MAQLLVKDDICINSCNALEMFNGMQIYFCSLIICVDKVEKYQQSHIKNSFNISFDNSIDKINDDEIEEIVKDHIKESSKGYIKSIYFYSCKDIKHHKIIIDRIKYVLSHKLTQSSIDIVSKNAKYYILTASGYNAYNRFAYKYPFLCNIDDNKSANDQTMNINKNTVKTKSFLNLKEYPNEIIEDRVYLGDVNQAFDLEILHNLNITHIVNCTRLEQNKFEFNKEINIKYLKLNVADMMSENIRQHFGTAISFIEFNCNGNKNNRVLIHCHSGVSRSVTIIIAYVMKIKNMKLNDAMHFVKQQRPFIQPNDSFLEQLMQFEKEIFPDIEQKSTNI